MRMMILTIISIHVFGTKSPQKNLNLNVIILLVILSWKKMVGFLECMILEACGYHLILKIYLWLEF